MKRFTIVLTILLLMFVILPAGAAHADGLFDRTIKDGETVKEDIAVLGDTLVVEEGAILDGDVSVFGGTVTLDGEIQGDVAVFGGNVTLSGTVDGDMVVFGGNLVASDTARMTGECLLIGGALSGDGAADFACDAVGDNLPEFLNLPAFISPDGPRLPRISDEVRVSIGGPGFLGTIAETAGRSLMLGLLALLAATVWPAQLKRVNDTVTAKPAASGAVGLLTAIAGASLIAILALVSAILTIVCIGLLGFPIVFLLGIVLAAAGVFGWVAIGNLLGEQLAGRMNLSNRSLAVTTALGTCVLTLVIGLMSSLPPLLGGWLWSLVGIALACAGLGAVALTRFGTRPYPFGIGNGAKVAAVLETLPETEAGE